MVKDKGVGIARVRENKSVPFFLMLGVKNMKTKEDKFKRELEVFRTEVESGIQFFYTYLTINSILSKNKQALRIVNLTPSFWNTNSSALQTSFFIVLGRIFDNDKDARYKKHTINTLLQVTKEHSDIFSAKALEVRKRSGSANADEWISDYMKDVYVPTDDDFKRLEKYVSKYRKIYEDRYQNIRHKRYAHKEVLNQDDVYKLFAQTNIPEIQKLLTFLNRLHEALWQLFHNGRKPTFRKTKYSVKSIMKKIQAQEWRSQDIQELTVQETKKFFDILLSIPNQREQEKGQATLQGLKGK